MLGKFAGFGESGMLCLESESTPMWVDQTAFSLCLTDSYIQIPHDSLVTDNPTAEFSLRSNSLPVGDLFGMITDLNLGSRTISPDRQPEFGSFSA